MKINIGKFFKSLFTPPKWIKNVEVNMTDYNRMQLLGVLSGTLDPSAVLTENMAKEIGVKQEDLIGFVNVFDALRKKANL